MNSYSFACVASYALHKVHEVGRSDCGTALFQCLARGLEARSARKATLIAASPTFDGPLVVFSFGKT